MIKTEPVRAAHTPLIVAMARALEGQEFPGGCSDCNAFLTVKVASDGLVFGVHHDHGCPELEASP